MNRVFTPGRVNLLGEHIDYNGGLVLPTALPQGVTIEASIRDDGRVIIRSDAFDGVAERRIGDAAVDHWSDYILGAVKLSGVKGADIHVSSNLPHGAGISSSAAVTVGVVKALLHDAITDVDAAILARRVENEFIGMPCGIMDQMAVALADPGQVLALDTHTLTFDLIALPIRGRIAVMHSGVHRSLNEGRYAERKAECDRIKAVAGRDDICRMSDTELGRLDGLDDTLIRRLHHCVSEHRRALEGAEVLLNGDIARFGCLMTESHKSLRDDFNVSVPAIDRLVDICVQTGALGARMTGGGFGGCVVAILPETINREIWLKDVCLQYPDGALVSWV